MKTQRLIGIKLRADKANFGTAIGYVSIIFAVAEGVGAKKSALSSPVTE